MTPRPKNLADRPATLALENPRGDVLADVLGVALVGHTLYKRIECGAPWGMRVAARDRSMFYLVARGSALLEVDGDKPRSLSAGDAVFLLRGAAHTLRDSPATRALAVCDKEHHKRAAPPRFGGDGARTSLIAGFFELGDRPPPLLDALPATLILDASVTTAPGLATVLQLLVAESASPGPASAVVLQRLADVLLVHALRAMVGSVTCKHRGLAALGDPAVHEALRIMHSDVSEPWTVEALASKVGLSRSAFAARFVELVGEPPLQYLARWRMTRAAELLRDTRAGIDAVAGRVGYESVPSFTRAFKRWRGESPGAFRRRSRATA